jgi:quinol monooxygenase YgiN
VAAVVVVAEIEFQPDRAEEGFALLEQASVATHAKDPGCELYALHRDPEDPTRAVMIEKWESGEALAAHGETDHIKAVHGFDGFGAPTRIQVLEAAGFGDAEKGAL